MLCWRRREKNNKVINKKSVQFNPIVEVHIVCGDPSFRRSLWQQEARDRERFRLRIEQCSLVLNPVLENKLKQIKNNLIM